MPHRAGFHPPVPRPGAQGGATLVELVIVLGILALLLGSSVGSLDRLFSGVRLRGALTDFMSDLQLARAVAIQRNARVVMCKGQTGCVQAAGWEQGWLLFEDANRNGRLDDGEEVLQRHPPLHGALRLRGNATVADYLGYNSLGASRLQNGGFQAGTLTLCQAAGASGDAWQVVINATGRVRTQPAPATPCP